jgi:hypothetical protein
MQKEKKMKTIIIKTLLVLLCLSLFSCKKKIDENYRPEFIGYWFCPPGTFSEYAYDINIDKNSNGVYQMFQGWQVINTIRGIARASNKKLKIGMFHSFDITEYPNKIDTASSKVYIPIRPGLFSDTIKANWRMGLADVYYYKADY